MPLDREHVYIHIADKTGPRDSRQDLWQLVSGATRRCAGNIFTFLATTDGGGYFLISFCWIQTAQLLATGHQTIG